MTTPEHLIPSTGWLRKYVDLWTPHGEAPESAHLGAGLAVLSAAVGWRAWIQWGASAEPVCLYVMMEGGSATAKKTTTARTAATLAKQATRGTDGALRVKSIQHTSQRGLIDLIGPHSQDKADEYEHTPPPGVVLDWDEFGAVLGRPGDGKAADWLGQVRAALMSMYSGRHGGIQTGGLMIPSSRCAVAILATMTRVELEQRISMGLLRDGFMGRFVLIPHPGRRAWLAQPPAWTTHDTQARDELATHLGKIATSRHELGDVFKRLTPHARELRQTWYQATGERLEHQADNGGEADRGIADAFGRLQTTAMKVAAVACVAELDPDEPLYQGRIEEHHVRYGIALAEHALQEVANLATSGEGTPEDRFAKRVEEYLVRRNGRGPAGRKELLDACVMDGLSRERRWMVVETLARDGTVQIEKVQTSGRPRLEVSLCR